MTRCLSVGVVGCGVIAPEHIRDYQRIEGVTVRWACDLLEERAREKATSFGIEHTATEFRALLADPTLDVVSVCTDHASHAAIVCAALDAGKHVLCEKPLGSTTTALDAMVAAHARNPRTVFGGVFQHRFDAAHRYLKQLLDQGRLGKLLTCSAQLCCVRTEEYYRSGAWRGTWAGEGGAALINQSIHYVDTLAWVCGGVAQVRGAWSNRTHQGVIEAEDTAVAALSLRCGALGTITATTSSHLDWEPTLTFRGTLGSIDLCNGRATKIVFADEAVQREVEAGFAAARDTLPASAVKVYYGPSHAALVEDFVAAVREGRAPVVTGESARHAVDIVLAVYESQKSGSAVEIPAPIG